VGPRERKISSVYIPSSDCRTESKFKGKLYFPNTDMYNEVCGLALYSKEN